MKGQSKLIAGLIMGAGTMYLLDPDRGARRRSLLRDRGVHWGHKLSDGIGATARDLRNRSAGAAAELRSRLRNEQVDDQILHDRVRSAIGRVVTHPGAINVTVSEGRVMLTGDVLLDEVNDLIGRIERVPGVTEVRNELAMHRTTDGVAELQGGRSQGRHAGWNPAARFVLGAAGGAIALQGLRMKGSGGRALTFLGSGLLSRAASRMPAGRSTGAGAQAEAVTEPMAAHSSEPEPAARSTSSKRRRSKR
jgi:hypothetical protein